MPTAPKRPCSWPNCPTLVTKGRCATHRSQVNRPKGSATQRGYGQAHQSWREDVRLRYGPYCGDPDQRHAGTAVVGTVADHIVPRKVWDRDEGRARVWLAAILTARGRVAQWTELSEWSLDNGQLLCESCHNSKTARENNNFWGHQR